MRKSRTVCCASRGIDRQDSELAKSAYHDDARDDHIAVVGSGAAVVDWVNGHQGHGGGSVAGCRITTPSTMSLTPRSSSKAMFARRVLLPDGRAQG